MDVSDGVISRLRRKCLDRRRDIIEMLYRAGGGHGGGSLSVVEILVVLYSVVMRVRPEEPDWPERDRFVLSKGHAAPALYAVLAEHGFFPRDLLWTFSQAGTRLQKHIEMQLVPGTELSTGSLGQGLSVSVGMALADRLDGKDRHVYALIGDGESQEGQIWEAAMAAGHFKLDKLIAFLDCNRCTCSDYTDAICSVEPLDEKWGSFGWHVQRVNGHNLRQIIAAVDTARRTPGAPHMIVADTIKGKDVSYMENDPDWHSKAINEENYHIAMADLDAIERGLAEEGQE
jgi:transketolase